MHDLRNDEDFSKLGFKDVPEDVWKEFKKEFARELKEKGDNVTATIEYNGKIARYKYSYGENIVFFVYDKEKNKFIWEWESVLPRHKLKEMADKFCDKLNKFVNRRKGGGVSSKDYMKAITNSD